MINFNAGEKDMIICTADPVHIRKLDRLVEKFPNHYQYVKSEYCKGEKVYRYYKAFKKNVFNVDNIFQNLFLQFYHSSYEEECFQIIQFYRKGFYMLTRCEQETVINFNAEDKEMIICTADPVHIRKLDKLVEKFPNHYQYVKSEYCKGEEVYRYYKASKKMLKYKVPVILPEERKEKLRQQLQKAREKSY